MSLPTQTNFLGKYRICMTAAAKIKELREAYGIEPTLDEVICLHELGKLCENPPGDETRYLRGEPELAGNVWLFPFTIGASLWWRDAMQKVGANDPAAGYLLPFALHHARHPDVLNRCQTLKQIRAEVQEFVRGLSCTVAELDYAIDRILPATENTAAESEHKPVDWAEVVGVLCRYFKGTTPDYWLWATAMDVAVSLLSKSAKIMEAEGDTFDERDPAFRAVHNLQMACNEIVRARGMNVK